MLADEVVKFLTARRKQFGITGAQIGAELGISGQAIGRWERGECYPEMRNLFRWAEVLACEINLSPTLMVVDKSGNRT